MFNFSQNDQDNNSQGTASLILDPSTVQPVASQNQQ